MTQQTATAILKDEHHSIQRVVAAMVLLADRLETGRDVQAVTLREAVEFMRLVYQTHERKEESHLFPALQQKGISVHSVPTRRLVEEHQRGKTLVAQLGDAVAGYDRDSAAARGSLVASLRGLAELYPLHIWQEDLLLFQQADNALSREDNEVLLRRFTEVDEAAGGEVRVRLQQMTERLERAAW